MSDFDKEAEREKLREKYEREQADREATQRMSDLLLKGATMTNTHCNTCGDPLFRQNGTTFCPSCHGGPEAIEGTPLEEETAAEGESDPETGDSTAADADSATEAGNPPVEGESDDAGAPTRSDPRRETARVETPASEPSNAASDAEASRPDSELPSPETPARSAGAGGAGGAGSDLETARASLTRALERFAREAATTEDPRYARECLEAAHEAADTLAALER